MRVSMEVAEVAEAAEVAELGKVAEEEGEVAGTGTNVRTTWQGSSVRGVGREARRGTAAASKRAREVWCSAAASGRAGKN